MIFEGILLMESSNIIVEGTSFLIAGEHSHNFFIFKDLSFEEGNRITDVDSTSIEGRWYNHVDML